MELRRQLDRVRGRGPWAPWLACGAGIAALGAAVAVKDFTPRGMLVVPVGVPVLAPATAAPPSPDPAATDEEAPVYDVSSCADEAGPGTCDHARAAALRTLIQDWLAGSEWPRPGIEYRRGVIYVESDELAEGGPRATRAEAMRVCGSQARWLRTHIREQMKRAADDGELWCDASTCCYGGFEYMPARCVTFRPQTDDPEGSAWILDRWTSSWESDDSERVTARNQRFVDRAVRRLAGTRCHGEPRGTD